MVAFVLVMAAQAQTMNVVVGNVTYQFPAAQTGDMTYADGTTLTILGKAFTLSDIDRIYIDETEVTDNTVAVAYSGTSATVTVAGNVAQYITPTVSGAHVSIAQSTDVSAENVGEITYSLSGTSTDGEFYLTGSYKATVELNGVTLTNATPVYSGAAVNIQNGKRIDVSIKSGTTNTLTDAASGSQSACLLVKGHGEFKGKGTLNVYGLLKHAIKTGDYMSVKNCTINVLSAVGDGIHCNEYFLMESGVISISNVGDDGIQAELDGTTSTGETTDHEDEDSGNIYISDGTITVAVTATAAKGIKADGDITVSGGTITATTSGGGEWDSDDTKTKASAGISADGNMVVSGGTMKLTSTGAGGKGISVDGTLNVSDGTITITTSGGIVAYVNGTLYNGYTGSTDNLDSNYKSSPKGIKADGAITISGGTISVSASNEGIESKSTLDITGGHVYSYASDDAINSSSDLTISGGYVCAYSTGNDGIDANGNCYIKGGVVYAIGASSPEVAIDANTEENYKLYVSGGTLVAIGGLESGSSLTQACYSTSSWNKSTWYALYNSGNLALAFKTPTSGGTTLVVSTSGTTTLKSGVTLSGGTEYFNGMGNIGATVSGGSSVTLSSYTSSGGGGGGNPGGGPGRQ